MSPGISAPSRAPWSFDLAYGRLYVKGPHFQLLGTIPGAALNYRKQWCELTLTLTTMRKIRQILGLSRGEMAAYCSPTLLRWGMAAGRIEQGLDEIEQKLSSGWLVELPWTDATGERVAPFRHQETMASVAITLEGGAAFFCEMGTGKTRAALEAMRHLSREGRVPSFLVICPLSVTRTWARQIEQWTPELRAVLPSGTVASRGEQLDPRVERGTVYVINYDVVARLMPQLSTLMDAGFGLICDESHKIKNPLAQRSKAIMALATRSQWRLPMTGSPMLQGLQDLFSQMYVSDHGFSLGSNWVQFRREWFEEDRFGIYPKPRAMVGITEAIKRRVLRYTKADCLDLPPKIYEKLEVEMTAEQKKAYKEMAEYLVATMPSGDTTDAATKLVSMLRTAQITSGWAPTTEGTIQHFARNPKLELLDELIRDNIAQHQIIVWAWWRQDIALLREKFADLHPVVINGDASLDDRELAEKMFQEGRSRLLIANQAVGGTGLNLQACSLAIYYSQPFHLEAREQSEDRSHRSGSERHEKVTYITLLCRGSIDEIIMNSLERKEDVATTAMALTRHYNDLALAVT